MKKVLIVLFVLPLFGFAEISSIQSFLEDEGVKNASVSICVSNVETNEQLLLTTPQLCVTPASVLKLITTATALELFGSKYIMSTLLGYRGQLNGRMINGDLLVKGGGDPTLGSSYYTTESRKRDFLLKWVQTMLEKGIDSINGNLVVDPFIFEASIPQTWIWEDLGNYYGAAAQGIAIFDNTVSLHFKTGSKSGDPAQIIYTNPIIPNLRLKNEVVSSKVERDLAYVFGSPYDSFRKIEGTLPRDRDNFEVKASIPNPVMVLGFELKSILENAGIYIDGEVMVEKCDDIVPEKVLVEWKSQSMENIIEQLNHHSINLFAEHLCKLIGWVQKGEGSTEAGCNAIVEFWGEKGIDTSNLFMADGSGLSRFNAFTAASLNEVLVYMAQKSQCFDAYKNSVPLLGMEGTQKYYFKESPIKGLARAKSGSMTRVRSFAGYMTTRQGTEIAFTVMANNFNCSSTEMVSKMEKLIESFYLEF